MPVEPTTEYRIVLASITIAGGLIVSALYMVVVIVLWRRWTRGPILLFPVGLVVIAVGLSGSGALRLVGLTMGTDNSYPALGVPFGATVVALALLTIGLVRRRRRTSAR